MSYEIFLRSEACKTCGHRDTIGYLPNPTYNLTPIFDLALSGETLPSPDVPEACVVLFHAETDRPRGLRLLSGKPAGDTVSILQEAMVRMSDPKMRARFVCLEPTNKWGDFRGACEVIEKLLDAAKENPDYVWEVQ